MSKVLDALAALATIGTFIIAFFDSYEVRIKFRRRSRDADGDRELRRRRKSEWPGVPPEPFNQLKAQPLAL